MFGHGLFSPKELESKSRPSGKLLTCNSCGLVRACTTPKMKPWGKFQKKILVVGTCPGKTDDERGHPWAGSVGKRLSGEFASVGINLEKDCLSTYAVNCFTSSDNGTVRPPKKHELDCCNASLQRLIEESKPKLIVAFGITALTALIGNKWKGRMDGIDKWEGCCIPDRDLNCWILPLFEPKEIFHRNTPEYWVKWRENMKTIGRYMDKPLPAVRPLKIVYPKTLDFLTEIPSGSTVSIDFETTGLKPYAKGHKIICCAVATSSEKSYSFLIPDDPEELQKFRAFLANPTIKKIGQNIKFEHQWAKVTLKTTIKGWKFDTMIASHIEDNRRGWTGLKFQAYVKLGVSDYNSIINPYWQSDGIHKINRIEKCLKSKTLRKELLKYCALDTLYTYELCEIQVKKGIYNEAYKLFHKGVLAFADAEMAGIRFDLDYVHKAQKKLHSKILKLTAELEETDFHKAMKKAHKGNAPFNALSGQQLAHYLFEVIGLKSEEKTEKGNYSTDDKTLRGFKIPALDLILEIKKYQKILSTYLDGFVSSSVDGWVHPSFNLHNVITYRGSSDNPNFQNVPKRDQEAQTICRSSLKARPGNHLLELDFKGVEVAVGTCYHKDPTMIKYLTGGGDMHTDVSKQLFFLKEFDKDVKELDHLRKATKNSFVFPQFYGDYYVKNVKGLCEWLDLPYVKKWKRGMGVKLPDGRHISDHLIDNGVFGISSYENHVKDIEYDFWHNRFPVYNKWRKKFYNAYLKNGFAKSLTGFTLSYYMRRNQAVNYPVQGSAFHCLLWSFIQLNKELKKFKLESRIIGQIHDSIVLDVKPSELKVVMEMAKRITTIKLAEEWRWINIPLGIDAEISPAGGSWAEMEKIKI